MREVPEWDQYWMEEAFRAAGRSKDPSTQVGAVIVDADNNVVMTGYNGFAPGAPETPVLWGSPEHKYPRVIHAEENAIARSAKVGRATGGAVIYCTHFPCNDCAKLIVAAGIKLVIAAQLMDRWDPESARKRLDEGKVLYYVDDYGVLRKRDIENEQYATGVLGG